MERIERIEGMRREVAHDLTAWVYRGGPERRAEVAPIMADMMMAVDADRMEEARSLMQKLLDRRAAYRLQELVEAREVKAERGQTWWALRNAAKDALNLDAEQLGAIDRVLKDALGNEDADEWLDVYRGLGFEGLLLREATPKELAALRRNRQLRLLLEEASDGR